MRNLKRALSLLLSSTMVLGMVVMGGSAAGYQDVDASNDNQEAIEVLQAVGIMSGVDDAGNFNPDGSLTRNEMAVVMAHLLNLDYDYYRGVNTFTDVPDWAAPYVAACVAEGVTAGIGNGLYGGDQKITAAQAGLMVMKALGYFQNQEDFGDDWQIATIRQASYINLFDKVNSNADAALTRGQVAQLVLNGLKSDMVTFTGDKGVQIGDVTVGYHAEYTPKTNAAVKYNSINTGKTDIAGNNQYYIQLGEELYNGELKLQNTTDVFGRPSRYWEYKGAEVGTYVKNELLRKEYTAKVTGKDLYELLGTSTIDEYGLSVVIDGVDSTSQNSAIFDKTDMVRTNTKAVGDTGNGVLTQVYVDTQSKQITISVINTYLAKAEEDYDTKDEDVSLTIYEVDNVGTSKTPVYVKTNDTKVGSYNVSVDDFDVADVVEDDLFLVTLANGEIQSLQAPEILSDASLTSFKLNSYVTADGTQYDYADTAMYDEDVLDKYDNQNMKDVTYNVILDNYGYLIGIELNQDPDKYVFLTGLDGKYSNLSVKEADANVIFLDGTMSTVTVNLDKSTISDAGKNLSQLNTWCTYTVDSKGVYTLKEVAVSGTASAISGTVDVAQYAQDVGVSDLRDSGMTTKTIDEKHVSLAASYNSTGPVINYVYGNDDTVYINVELDDVVVDDASNGGANRWIIDDVESVTTGVKNVNLVMSDLGGTVNGYRNPSNEIYTLYNDDGYVIAAVTIGENEGSSSNYVYVTSSSVNREELTGTTTRSSESGTEWKWSREVYVEGEIKELTEVGSSLDILDTLVQGEWYEVKYDADGNVRKAEALATKLTDGNKTDGFVDDVNDIQAAVVAKDNVLLADTTNVQKLTFKNGTLYTDTAALEGFSVSPDVKVLLALADEKGYAGQFDETEIYTGYKGLEQALRDMNAVAPYGIVAADGSTRMVEVSAIMNASGSAISIVINDKEVPGNTTPSVPGTTDSMGVTVNTKTLSIDAKFLFDTSAGARRAAIANALAAAGVDYSFIDPSLSYVITKDNTFYTIYESDWISVTVDGTVVEYVDYNSGSGDTMTSITMSSYTKGTGYIMSTNDGSTYTYAQYSSAANPGTITDHVDIKTGYVKAPMVASITGATGSPTITVNYKNDGSTGYILVGDTAEITIAYGASDLSGATDVTFKEAVGANTVTVSASEATAGVNVKLSYKASASDVTALTVKETAVVSPTPFNASVSVTDAHGLTVAVYDAPTQAKAGETVTVVVAISGAIDDSTAATLTLSGTASWVTGQVPAGFTRTSGTVLTSDTDANYGNDTVYAQFTYVMTGSSDTVTITVA